MLSTSFFDMRNRNVVRILQTVWRQPELSRADIARTCDLAKSTVSSIVDELVQSAVLQETGSKASNGGRRPVGLVFNPDWRLSVGISLDHNRVEIVLCNLDGIVQSVQTKTLTGRSCCSTLILTVLSELQRMLDGQKLRRSQIAVVGLSMPGPLPPSQIIFLEGEAINYETFRMLLAKELNCPVIVDSNANMAALAESRLGTVTLSNDVFVLRLSHEVRSALIVDHKLQKGAQGRAGEIGHVRVPGIDRMCQCGKCGCINSVASTVAIVDRIRSSGIKVGDIDDVISAAVAGDKVCRHALAEAGQAVGYGIACCINILAPTDLIVTGRLVAAGEIFLEPLRNAIGESATPENLINCNLTFDDALSHIEAIGAGLAALSQDDFLLNLVSTAAFKVLQGA